MSRISAEALTDELMAYDEHTTDPDLTQIEEIVLQLRQRLGEQLARAVLARQENCQPGAPSLVPIVAARSRTKVIKRAEVRVGWEVSS